MLTLRTLVLIYLDLDRDLDLCYRYIPATNGRSVCPGVLPAGDVDLRPEHPQRPVHTLSVDRCSVG